MAPNSEAIPMASDPAGKPGKPLVVGSVEVSRNWKGAYQADFACPTCKAPLSSVGDALLETDTCPNCKATFAFAPDVQTAYRAHKQDVEVKAAEKQRAAEERKQKAAAERVRQDEEARVAANRAKAQRKADDQAWNEKVAAKRRSLKDVEFLIGTVTVLSFLGSFVMAGGGLLLFLSQGTEAGLAICIAGLVAFSSVLLVWGLFQCLYAIHQLLIDISAKLDRDRG